MQIQQLHLLCRATKVGGFFHSFSMARVSVETLTKIMRQDCFPKKLLFLIFQLRIYDLSTIYSLQKLWSENAFPRVEFMLSKHFQDKNRTVIVQIFHKLVRLRLKYPHCSLAMESKRSGQLFSQINFSKYVSRWQGPSGQPRRDFL